MLTREAILAAPPPALGSVVVPDWGGDVALRHMTLDQLLTWEEVRKSGAPDAQQRAAATLVLFGACQDDGAPLFSDADLPWLMAQPGNTLSLVATAVLDYSNGAGKATPRGN